MSSPRELTEDARAQMGPAPRWPAFLLVAGGVVVVTLSEVFARYPQAAATLDNYGSQTPWALVIIGALVLVASKTVTFVKELPDREASDE